MDKKFLFLLTVLTPCSLLNAVANDSLHCAEKTAKEVSETINFATSVSKVAGLSACRTVKKKEDRYSELNCQLMRECSKAKIGESPYALSFNPIGDYVAQDFAAHTLSQVVAEMDQLERLRNFSSVKYGIMTCSSFFESDNACQNHLMDTAFENLSHECSKEPKKSYCFSDGPTVLVKDFLKYTIPDSDKKESKMISFFKSRSKTSTILALANDKSFLTSFSRLLSDPEITAEEKLKQAFENLSALKKEGKLDPILSSEESLGQNFEEYKKSEQYNYFNELLKTDKLNDQSALVGIEEFRMKKSLKLLKFGCDKTPTYKKICLDTTNISTHEEPALIMRPISPKTFNPQDNDFDGRLDIVRDFYNLHGLELEDFKLLMDTQRCARIFNGNADHDSSLKKSESKSEQSGFSFEAAKNSGSADLNEKELSLIEKYTKDQAKILTTKSSEDLKSIDHLSHKSEKTTLDMSASSDQGEKSIAQEMIKEQGGSKSQTMIPNTTYMENSSAAPGNYFIPNRSFTELSEVAEKNGKEKGSEDIKKDLGPSSDLNDRLNELTKKLSVSEENLARFQRQEQSEALEKSRQEKMTENNKTIADLKKQISDLRAQVKAPEASMSRKGNSNNFTSSENNSFVKEASSASVNNSVATPPRGMEERAVNTGFANTSTEALEIDKKSLTSHGGKGESSAPQDKTDNKNTGGLVLTKVDGMTSERANETIGEKILESGGQPFYIEEEGMVKEIVPVLKDGKVAVDDKGRPVYTKVLKGKVGEMILRGKVPVKGRSIASVGDLKRDQEEKLKRERAEYLKLKKISSEVLEKK